MVSALIDESDVPNSPLRKLAEPTVEFTMASNLHSTLQVDRPAGTGSVNTPALLIGELAIGRS